MKRKFEIVHLYFYTEIKLHNGSRLRRVIRSEMVNFASTYFVGTRVIKPLLARLLGQEAKVADPGMHWNRWFASLPATGDYGTQKLFVLRKRG